MSYFCSMKRFLTCCILAVTLFTGVATTLTSGKECVNTIHSSYDQQQTVPSHHSSFFSATDFLLLVGLNNEQIQLTNSLQNVSYRIFPSMLNAFRIQHSIKTGNQKFFIRSVLFLLNSANKQLDGYYLFHLCKLLI